MSGAGGVASKRLLPMTRCLYATSMSANSRVIRSLAQRLGLNVVGQVLVDGQSREHVAPPSKSSQTGRILLSKVVATMSVIWCRPEGHLDVLGTLDLERRVGCPM